MTASQSLFRRHRNRDADENDHPSSTGGDVENRDVGGASSSADERRDGNDDNHGSISIQMTSLNNQPSNASPPTDDEEQELVVQIPNTRQPGNPNTPSPFVLPVPTEEAMALRREAIHREVERVQRANFIHFLILCLVPTALLLIVIAAIVSEDGECSGEDNGLTVCEREPRSFVNAFTSRCICEAIRSVTGEDELGGVKNNLNDTEEGV